MLWACDFVRDWPFKTESIVVRFFSLICSDLEEFALKLKKMLHIHTLQAFWQILHLPSKNRS
jgi:hypothetical protein